MKAPPPKHVRLSSKLATTLAIVGAQPGCGVTSSDASPTTGDPVPPDAAAAGAGAGGEIALEGIPCVEERQLAEQLLADQAILFPSGKPRVFYSWTTEEQAAELRAGTPLFSRSEREGLGRGYAFTALADYAEVSAQSSQPDPQQRAELARLIGEELFATARYAWTNAWATRLGWPGEDYGDQLLRIELEPEAWIVQFDGSILTVLDQQGEIVAIEAALAQPERIGAVYFLRSSAADGPSCGTFGGEGGGGGYREFILGNLAMVREWSLGTEALHAVLEDDIAALEQLAELLETCPSPSDYYEGWNADVLCGWYIGNEYGGPTPRTYEDALALPSELYYPSPDRLRTLLDTLRGSLFEPDPWVVAPNESP